MKIPVSKTTTEFIEIELPVFRKDSCHYYKVISEKHCVQICTLSQSESIALYHSGLAFGYKDIECTEQEFMEQFEKVTEKLKSYLIIPNN